MGHFELRLMRVAEEAVPRLLAKTVGDYFRADIPTYMGYARDHLVVNLHDASSVLMQIFRSDDRDDPKGIVVGGGFPLEVPDSPGLPLILVPPAYVHLAAGFLAEVNLVEMIESERGMIDTEYSQVYDCDGVAVMVEQAFELRDLYVYADRHGQAVVKNVNI